MSNLDYTYDEDRMRVRVNCLGYIYGASVEDFEELMARVIDIILEVKKVNSIVLAKEREYEYDPEQVKLLVEVANVLEEAVRERILYRTGGAKCRGLYPQWGSKLRYIIVELMRKDPLGAYIEIIREMRNIKVMARTFAARYPSHTRRAYDCFNYYLSVLSFMKSKMEKTKLIKLSKPHLTAYHVGDRSIYRKLFMPNVRPNFMFTRYMITPPINGISLDRYNIGDTRVEIFKLPDSTQNLYFVLPPEFRLSEEKYAVLDASRRYMATHKPKAAEFVKSERIREIFYNIGRDIIRDTADRMAIHLTSKEVDQLANILTRYTAGFGILEVLLSDERLQDLYINSPIEVEPILVYHGDWEECKTNLIPTMEDAEAWATRLRIQSGRPLDEANPVLDTDLTLPGGSARFAIITKTLSPQGLGFAIRRHRDKPWTLPLFIQNRMISPLAAGLFSFLIDGSVSMLVAGGRSSGKTSFLTSLMLEILPKVRIVTIEDSVAGDCEIIYERNGKIERNKIGNLIDKLIDKYGKKLAGRDIVEGNPENIKVFALDFKNKVKLSMVGKFIRHKVNKPIYEVETRTGRKIRVTGDHSLFTLGSDGKIKSIEVNKLKTGDYIVTPRELPISNKEIKTINISDYLKPSTHAYISGLEISKIFENRQLLIKLASKFGYSKATIGWWKRNNVIPYEVFTELIKSHYEFEKTKLSIKFSNHSKSIPMVIDLDEDFLKFIGLWLADGCYDKNSIIISAEEEEIRNIVRNVAHMFNSKPKMHSDKFSLMINSNSLKFLMRNILGLEGGAFSKRVPSWVFSLSKKQVGYIINGVISGDGCISDKEIMLDLRSQNLVKDIQTLLLMSGIIGRIKERNGFYCCRISSLKSIRKFKESIGVLNRNKADKLEILSNKTSTRDTTDVIPLALDTKIQLGNLLRGFNSNDYVIRDNNIGRAHLSGLLNEPDSNFGIPEELFDLANSDILWDEIREIKRIKSSGFVYDISVPYNENFICENILAHNTLELPIAQLRELKYNVESLKSRSVITNVETEMPADEALRAALRLGDSALIVGEVRSVEARALYEAMRIGALSNVVAGTIHGESAYGVYDRVVNDLGVPPTSFKATDIIPICKALRSADGLHRFRRITEITEVRKEWEGSPLKEHGFANLMEYSSKEDMLKPTDMFVNGESDVINRIASHVKEWTGDWNAVWENINLRAKTKEAIVSLSNKAKMPEMLEAEWIVRSNQRFHIIADNVRQEVGYPEPKRIYEEWVVWLKQAVTRGQRV